MELFLPAISAFIVQIWFQDGTLINYNFYFNGSNHDYCRTFWYFGSSNIKENEY